MENTGYVALSRQLALGQEMNLIANNIANLNTTGYKSQHAIFTQELLGDGDEDQQLKSVLDYGQFSRLESGPIRQTSNTFDFALEGPGYFTIQHGVSGNTHYTRAGNFTRNDNNELVTAAGHLVLDANGGTIEIPERARDIVVTTDGTITSSEGDIGQLNIVEFENEYGLSLAGDGLFTTPQNPQQPENTNVRQGMLEGSNVQAVLEMTRMIDISRAYQMNNTVLQNEHERIRNAINQISELN